MINQNHLNSAREYSLEYSNNSPFPHIVLDNFFDPSYLESVLAEFPNLSGIKNKLTFNNPYEKKLAGKGESNFGPKTKELMHFLNSEPFLIFLQELTGIEETLIGDPYFSGGGLHEIKPGGLLKLHADFNKHPKTKLDRRLNLLIYLNKDWKQEYGGDFELWPSDLSACGKKVSPIFNRIAIFSTTDFSYHGHPDPLRCPETMSRKSLALYYYSNGRPKSEVNSNLEEHSTIFKERHNENIEYTFNFKLTDLIPPLIYKIYKVYKKGKST